MSKIFAKLFERDGNQVLVCFDQDAPGIIFTFKSDGDEIYVSPKIGFTPKENSEEALEKAWVACERAFSRVDEAMAFELRRRTLDDLAGAL